MNWYLKSDSDKDFQDGFQAFLREPSTHWTAYVVDEESPRDWSSFKEGWFKAQEESGLPEPAPDHQPWLRKWKAEHPENETMPGTAETARPIQDEPEHVDILDLLDPEDALDREGLAEEERWDRSVLNPPPKSYGQDPWRNSKNR